MNVLSLFDGMSCGQLALDQLGIKVDNYYAAEIDKYAIEIAKKNYPNTRHLGDVTSVYAQHLPKIDLLMGGSPCQGFSFAGKQLNFDDPRSALFFEFVRLLKETKPKYFMLENVRMKQEYQDIISDHLGVKPIIINSALVSAQNRVRFYWTNIPTPYTIDKDGRLNGCIADRHIYLKDILEPDATEPMLSNIYGGFKEKQPRVHTGKSVTIRTAAGGGHIPSVTLVGALRGRSFDEEGNPTDWKSGVHKQVLEIREDSKSNSLTLAQKDNLVVNERLHYRKLMPLECERLQTVPDGYTEGVSNTQRYKMLGNGWTVEVIKHIFKNME